MAVPMVSSCESLSQSITVKVSTPCPSTTSSSNCSLYSASYVFLTTLVLNFASPPERMTYGSHLPMRSVLGRCFAARMATQILCVGSPAPRPCGSSAVDTIWRMAG